MLMKISDALSPEAKAELMRPVQVFDPRCAQVGEGFAQWVLVQVFSRDAEAQIAKRCFGLYVPESRETLVRRGRRVDVRKPMFPGYALVFMWLNDGNWNRLTACEGVISLIGALHDEEVDLIRAVENKQKFPRSRPKPRHYDRMRRRRWEDWLIEIRSLDSEKRNQALRKLLSLF
jgi:transcription antitermination factor NusG